MSTNSERPSRLQNGTPVRTREPNQALRGEWTTAGWLRKKSNVIGEILRHSDSHGLCYEVRHEDGTTGWYDPSELTDLTKM